MLFKKGSSCPIFIASGIKEIKYFLLTIFSLILYFSSITVTFWGKNHEHKWGRIYFKYITFCLCNKSGKFLSQNSVVPNLRIQVSKCSKQKGKIQIKKKRLKRVFRAKNQKQHQLRLKTS